nr:uncharacterized protein LOC110002965 isoform X2 [Labrus bergylta]
MQQKCFLADLPPDCFLSDDDQSTRPSDLSLHSDRSTGKIIDLKKLEICDPDMLNSTSTQLKIDGAKAADDDKYSGYSSVKLDRSFGPSDRNSISIPPYDPKSQIKPNTTFSQLKVDVTKAVNDDKYSGSSSVKLDRSFGPSDRNSISIPPYDPKSQIKPNTTFSQLKVDVTKAVNDDKYSGSSSVKLDRSFGPSDRNSISIPPYDPKSQIKPNTTFSQLKVDVTKAVNDDKYSGSSSVKLDRSFGPSDRNSISIPPYDPKSQIKPNTTSPN